MPLNIDWQQILLHLFNFIILFAILYFLLYKPVKRFMDGRADYYHNLEEQTKANLAESETAKKEYMEKLAAADEEISEKKKKANAEIEQASAARLQHADEEATKLLADAHTTIEYDRAKMIQEAKGEITELVATAAEKIVAQASTSQAYDQFLDAAERGEADE